MFEIIMAIILGLEALAFAVIILYFEIIGMKEFDE